MTEKNSNQLNVDNMLGRMADVEAQSGSNTMCLAKWMQSTVYLMNGHTHSCHHPSVHKIPISEIKRKPSALHNTEHKMKVREEMLAGQRPKECQYCWNIEDLSVIVLTKVHGHGLIQICNKSSRVKMALILHHHISKWHLIIPAI
jgi:radical SAM protein with 4Fe4S-binding SPASM domain